jgi:hypothetical protein
MKTLMTSGAIVTVLLLAACGETPQTASTPKSDVAPWQGVHGSHVAEGWTAGDKTSWEQQIRKRTLGQNEYSRTAFQP